MGTQEVSLLNLVTMTAESSLFLEVEIKVTKIFLVEQRTMKVGSSMNPRVVSFLVIIPGEKRTERVFHSILAEVQRTMTLSVLEVLSISVEKVRARPQTSPELRSDSFRK